MRIKDISIEGRPRERLFKFGPSALSDAELLAIILQKGTKNENAIDLSNRLIMKFGLDNLSQCSLHELEQIKGIGIAKACQIQALFEINNRNTSSKYGKKPVKCAKDVYNYISPFLKDLKKELFITLHLDSKNAIVKNDTVSLGTLNASLIHPREIFKSAIKESANSIILVHNHPSGDPSPSEDDKKITEKLISAGELLDIKVLDHVIVGKNSYYSFKEQDLDLF